VEIRVAWAWLADWSAAGEAVNGPGDVRLGTVVRVASPGAFDLTLGWEAKLPDARDEGELGTDETDITFGATAGWRRGAFSARVGAGLAILGNPLRFANQDDVPVVRASFGWERESLGIIGRGALDVPTERNPVRADGDLAIRFGGRLFGLVHGGGGFVPASADWQVGVAVGYAAPLPTTGGGA
jgi:hypothetical protein